MTDQITKRPRLGPSHEAEENAYRALSGLAVGSLILGLLSTVALVDPRAALVSAAGIAVGFAALWQIARRRPELVGRKIALVGLSLSLLFGGISVGHCAAFRWIVTRQSQQVCMHWFDLMKAGRPELAYQLEMPPNLRATAGSDVWDYYCSDLERHENLGRFLDMPLSRTLLALGKKATVRFIKTDEVAQANDWVRVSQLYGVTFEQDGNKTTFLVHVATSRKIDKLMDNVSWQIVGLEGGVRPDET